MIYNFLKKCICLHWAALEKKAATKKWSHNPLGVNPLLPEKVFKSQFWVVTFYSINGHIEYEALKIKLILVIIAIIVKYICILYIEEIRPYKLSDLNYTQRSTVIQCGET